MLAIFRSKEENIYNLKSFGKWKMRFDELSQRRIFAEYHYLGTPEQRLYAAYTSFHPHLKNLIKIELSSDSSRRRQSILQTIYNVFTKKGMHGCSHLLKQDYFNDFNVITELRAEEAYEPVPHEWLKEVISFEELAKIYSQMYGSDINAHLKTPQDTSRDGIAWNRLLKLRADQHEIRNFDSGFCSGIALVEDGESIEHVTLLHYRRAIP